MWSNHCCCLTHKQKNIWRFIAIHSTLGEGSFVLFSSRSRCSWKCKSFMHIVTIFGLISGIVFGLISDTIGFRTKNKRSVKVPNKESQKNLDPEGLNIQFVEKNQILYNSYNNYFFSSGFNYGIMGGSMESIAEIIYWFSIIFTICCIALLIGKFLFSNHD